MQPIIQNYAHFALSFEKGCQKFMQASQQNMNFVYLQKTN